MPQMKSRQRSRSVTAEPPRVPEHAQLGDVPAEEERDRPVGHDAKLPGEERQLVEVVRPRHEPADGPTQGHAEDQGDPLVAAERGDLAEHAEAVGLRVSAEVLREAPRLAQRVLRGGRVRARRSLVRYAGAVAERPQARAALDTE